MTAREHGLKVIGRGVLVEFCDQHADCRKWIANWLADASANRWATSHDIKLTSRAGPKTRPRQIERIQLGGRQRLLETVGFNGQTSGKFAQQFAAAGYRTLVLPSTSPAHASLTFEKKLSIGKGYVSRLVPPAHMPWP